MCVCVKYHSCVCGEVWYGTVRYDMLEMQCNAARPNAWMHVGMYGCMYACMHASLCLYLCMHTYVRICMYVCMYMYIYI